MSNVWMAATVDFWGVLYTTAQRGFDADGSAFFLLSTTIMPMQFMIISHLLEFNKSIMLVS
jgi:hypothetical protein